MNALLSKTLLSTGLYNCTIPKPLTHFGVFTCLFENLERPAGRIGLGWMGRDGMDGAHGKTAENIVWDTMFSINHSYVLEAGSEFRGFLGEEGLNMDG
jgi:hypothetical protein